MKSYNEKHIITVNNLNVIFNKDTVNEVNLLNNLSFNLNYGELMFIRGDNGSGKSTLLNVLKKDVPDFNGSVIIKDRDINQMKDFEISKFTQFIYQNPTQGLCPNLTVYENLFFSLIKHQKPNFRFVKSASNKKRIVEKLEGLKLKIVIEKLDEKVNNLSGGERQLVCIAKIPLEEPELLLLDEPTASLDKSNETLVENLLFQIINEHRITAIWITHKDVNSKFDNEHYMFLKK